MAKRGKEGEISGERPMSPEEQIALLREALEQVELVMTYVNECNVYPKCPWCGGDKIFGHEDDCLRQVALEQTKPSPESQ